MSINSIMIQGCAVTSYVDYISSCLRKSNKSKSDICSSDDDILSSASSEGDQSSEGEIITQNLKLNDDDTQQKLLVVDVSDKIELQEEQISPSYNSDSSSNHGGQLSQSESECLSSDEDESELSGTCDGLIKTLNDLHLDIFYFKNDCIKGITLNDTLPDSLYRYWFIKNNNISDKQTIFISKKDYSNISYENCINIIMVLCSVMRPNPPSSIRTTNLKLPGFNMKTIEIVLDHHITSDETETK